MRDSPAIVRSDTPSSKRLRLALSALANDAAIPTASTLCEKAGISRTALYRYYPDIVRELHHLQNLRRRQNVPAKHLLDQLRVENETLKLQLVQLASLVDHYFSAWQEASALLKRRESEISSLRKGGRSQVLSIKK